MKKTFILLLFLPLWAGLLNGQTKADLADCIKIALASPEMEAAFTQEWGEKRPLYLQKPERRDIAPQPIDELMGQAFRIENPNAVASCGCGTSFSV